MNKKVVSWSAFSVLALIFAILQFIPSAPIIIPAQLPADQREAHRLLNFEGIDNFRDLGGYRTENGRQLKWGVLYRSGTFADASRGDQQVLSQLGLSSLIDFRSVAEKEDEPNQLPEPAPFAIVEIPTLDGGDNDISSEIMARLENGSFGDFNPDAFMREANRQFATRFTPQYATFMQVVLNAKGEPVVWHCSAGKDRSGYAAAIVLRILGVPVKTILSDYLMSREPALAARQRELLMLRLFKGEAAAAKLEVLLGVEEPWLQAAFAEIDKNHGGFDTYVHQGLGLSDEDISQLQENLLE